MKKPYQILHIEPLSSDIFLLRLKPISHEGLSFKPGQYTNLYNPNYLPEEAHPFAIASSPDNEEYLEFLIRAYGDWTQTLQKAHVGDPIKVDQPIGDFFWDKNDMNSVFLVGGVAISGFMSMMRYMRDENLEPKITLLYGNRTEDTIMHRKEVEGLISEFAEGSKVVHILSHIKPEDTWEGYRGFMTKEIIEKEISLDSKSTFYIVGPPIFIELMEKILFELQVDKTKIKVQKL